MPTFLTQYDVYRVIQRELPEDVYPDGAPSAFFSTADSYATAGVMADAYANLATIYANLFPQSAVEQLDDWEIKVFGHLAPSGLTTAQRQARLLQWLRTKITLNPNSQIAAMRSIVGDEVYIEILPWGGAVPNGIGWRIGIGRLGINTFLDSYGLFIVAGPNIFTEGYAFFGLTAQQWQDYLESQYSYTIRFYDFTPTAAQLAELNQLLDKVDRYSCQRTIETNVPATSFVTPYLMVAPP